MSGTTEHWFDINGTEDKFWAHAESIGLTKKLALKALGVTDMRDYIGSKEQAAQVLAEYADLHSSAVAAPGDEPEAERKPHWSDDTNTKEKFFATAGRHGFGPGDCLGILGVKNLYEYDGDLGKALNALTQHKKNQHVINVGSEAGTITDSGAIMVTVDGEEIAVTISESYTEQDKQFLAEFSNAQSIDFATQILCLVEPSMGEIRRKYGDKGTNVIKVMLYMAMKSMLNPLNKEIDIMDINGTLVIYRGVAAWRKRFREQFSPVTHRVDYDNIGSEHKDFEALGGRKGDVIAICTITRIATEERAKAMEYYVEVAHRAGVTGFEALNWASDQVGDIAERSEGIGIVRSNEGTKDRYKPIQMARNRAFKDACRRLGVAVNKPPENARMMLMDENVPRTTLDPTMLTPGEIMDATGVEIEVSPIPPRDENAPISTLLGGTEEDENW